MEFVAQKEDGFYAINAEAANFLKTIGNATVSIIGIVGSYRKGKSTLLNKLIGSRVFVTSESTQAKTKGLWFARLPQQDQQFVLLMDTEGIGSTEKEESH